MTMPTGLKHLIARMRAFLGRGDFDRELEQELETHLALLTEENIRRGMTPEQAARAARIRLGAPASLKEQHRDVRGLPSADAVIQDLRFAFRLIRRDRWFSAAAVAALALGIGANTVGFTIVNSTILRSLPFEDADRLYTVSWQNRSGRRSSLSNAEFQDWRGRTRSFAGLAAYSEGAVSISDDRALPEQAVATWLAINGFGVLRQRVLLGRDFMADDERPGADPVAIISHAIWKSRYAADPAVLGTTMRVNGRAVTIVGVMPEGMRFPDNTDLWRPFISTDAQWQRNLRQLRVFGRLQDGAGRRDALAELSGLGQQTIAAYPDATKDLVGVRLETFSERYIGGAGRPMILTVMVAVVFVLLIACANVANMLLSRSAARAREIAVRTAMGATRWRVVRQLLLESLVLGFMGGGIGLGLAVMGVRFFAAAMQRSGLPYWVVFEVDYVVVGYVAAVCMFTAVLFGLAPALHVSQANNSVVLKEGGRGSMGSRRERRFSAAMVVAELALTVILLAGSGAMVRSFLTLYRIDVGVDTSRLMTMRVQLPPSKYADPGARRGFFERLEPRLGAIPGVEAAAVTTGVPGRDGGERLLEIDGPARTAAPVHVSTVTISPRFFLAAGVPMVRGRSFDDADGAEGAESVIVNDRLAEQFFPGEDPIGKRLRFTQRQRAPGVPLDVWRTVVGVSGRILHGSSLDLYENAVVYIPYRQESPGDAWLLVRSALPPSAVMDAVRREVQGLDRDQPVFTIQTLAQLMEADRWWYRTWGGMLGAFAAIALVLSSMGLYAVMAYAVTQRTQEIGLRMAVGAQPRQVSWLILKRGLGQLAIGLVLGLAGALALSRVMRRGLAGVGPADPWTFAAIVGLLSVVCIAACLVPLRRAIRIDPVVALRAE
jgi:putative ABC transport system permease protein